MRGVFPFRIGGQENLPGENGKWKTIEVLRKKVLNISSSWHSKSKAMEVWKYKTCYLFFIAIILIYVYVTLFI